jgi:signal peptide peptidase SppA
MNTTDILAILPSHLHKHMTDQARSLDLLARMDAARKQEIKEEIEDYSEINRIAIREMLSLYFNQRQPMAVSPEGVATIHVKGVLSSGLTFLESCTEASDYRDIQADIAKASADPAVKAVLLRIDSPGGSCMGCLETAEMVKALTKPKAAHIGTLGGSAAYFIAAGVDAIYSEPSAYVGSIGTIMSFLDYAEMLKANGITPHIYTSPGADQKAAGNPLRKPTEEEEDYLKESIKAYGLQFVDFVLAQRPSIDPAAVRGNAVPGTQALAYNLVDGLATESQVAEELAALAS